MQKKCFLELKMGSQIAAHKQVFLKYIESINERLSFTALFLITFFASNDTIINIQELFHGSYCPIYINRKNIFVTSIIINIFYYNIFYLTSC